MESRATADANGSCDHDDHSPHTPHKNSKRREALGDTVPAAAAKTAAPDAGPSSAGVCADVGHSALHRVGLHYKDPLTIDNGALYQPPTNSLRHNSLNPLIAKDYKGPNSAEKPIEAVVRSLEISKPSAAEDGEQHRPPELKGTQTMDGSTASAKAAAPTGSSVAATTATATATTATATATTATATATTATATATTATTSDVQQPPPLHFDRAATALSVHLMALYKRVNEAFCRQRRLEGPGTKYNNGYDDSEGHYLVLAGEEILGRYTVQEALGKGSFGTVLRCYDEKRRENVALKITRRGLSFRTQAKLELDILLKLNANQHLNHLVVRLLKVFDWQGHLVLVFELLSYNLYQLIKCTHYNGVTLDLVRKFAYQLTQVLYYLEHTKPNPIIHCDLKPENILLRNHNRSGIRLIDFGSACYSNKIAHKYIQSRFYRSPEVILHLGYGTHIDRWSLGCVLVELHTGMPLFDGRTEAEQLARFEALLGPVPVDLLETSSKALKFYERTATGFQLKEPPLSVRSLESVLGVTTGGPRGLRKDQAGHDEHSYRQFHDFIAKFLVYRPAERMSCFDALRHPFLEPLLGSDQQQVQRAQAKQEQRNQEQQKTTAAVTTTKTAA